jgi:hypothetical protein
MAPVVVKQQNSECEGIGESGKADSLEGRGTEVKMGIG